MFKFRRRSVCASKANEFDVHPESDARSKETSSGVPIAGGSSSVKSVADSRTLTPKSPTEEKRFETQAGISGRDSQSVSGSGGEKSNGFFPGVLTKLSFGGDKLKANLIGHVMYDRKRKERQESISQGQERKVIRCADAKKSLSDDEGLNETEKVKDFKRTLSHDNFNPNTDSKFDDGAQKFQEKQEPEPIVFTPTVITIQNIGSKPESREPVVLADQPLANTMMKFSGSYEPELQRQLERSMNYSSNSGSKGPRRHRRHHRSSRHESPNFVADLESRDERSDGIESPVTGSSSSESIDEIARSIPLVKVEDSSSTKPDFEMEFSHLSHHHTEPSKPISFLESISGTGVNNQVMLSPRSGFLIRDAIDLPPSPPMMQVQLDPPTFRQSLLGENESTKINSLTHQVTNFKKHLKILEEEYEQRCGYRPSHADKLNNKEMKKCLMQLAKVKRDLKQLKDDPAAVQEANLLSAGKNSFSSHYLRGTPEALKSLDETVLEVQEFLSNKRRTSGRTNEPEDMSTSELLDEKFAMQRQLLLLEKRHGRPNSKQEKDIVRSLYDRYRAVKKFSIRAVTVKEINPDLVPILEHETLEFPEIESQGNSPSCSVVEINKYSPKVRRSRMSHLVLHEESDDEEEGEVQNESFNNMSLSDLEKRQKQVKEEKRRLRSAIRKFESEFENVAGRPPSKEEKYSSDDMQSCYFKYKRSRGTVRLLEVLITKKKYPQLLVDLSTNED